MKAWILRGLVAGLLVLASFGLPGADQSPFMILAGPKDVVRFELTDETGGKLWVLEANPPMTPKVLMYGEVPEGFVQLEPADHVPPRPLLPGEVLTMKTTSLLIVFTHTGVASSPTNMEIIDHSMKLLKRAD